MKTNRLPTYAVILAGGRGTRFWPRSRTRTPKQLLNIAGGETMLRQTVARLTPAFSVSNIFVVTNKEQSREVRKQLPRFAARRVIAEPVGRNTAAAICLAAIHIKRDLPSGVDDALMAVLPADHVILQAALYRRIVRAALLLARRPGVLVVLGIPPTRPEIGYGYIERGKPAAKFGSLTAYKVVRFTEKPDEETACKFVASRRYYWNAGMFFWRVSTYLDNLRTFLPATYDLLMRLADQIGTPAYSRALRQAYKKLRNISVDLAVMEPASKAGNVFVLPTEVGWSDIGSWAAVYELLAAAAGENVTAGPLVTVNAHGNFLWVPKKLVAAIGVNELVVVETDDALLICPRSRAQDVGQVVKNLEELKRHDLL